MFRKQKLNSDLEPQPLTPNKRAEILLDQSGEQLDRLLQQLASDNISEVETSLGFILVTPFDIRSDPFIVAETELNTLRERQFEGSLQRVWLAREMGQHSLSAWLDSITVRSCTVEMEATARTATLENSSEGLILNGTPVEMVDGVDSANPNVATTLDRLENIMQSVTLAAVATKFSSIDHAS